MRLTDRSLVATVRIAALVSGLAVAVLLWPYGTAPALFIGLLTGVTFAGMLAFVLANWMNDTERH